MGRKKVYKNAAEKQRAWRLRTGKQKVKVPLSVRVGEKLGTSEGQIRERKEGETWEEYSKYLKVRISRAGTATAKDLHRPITKEDGDSLGAKRAVGGYKEPQFSEEYYEIRRKYESDMEKLVQKPKRRKRKV